MSEPSTDLAPDYFDRPLRDVDPEVAAALRGELARQQDTLEMIASENFVPRAILECQGSVLTNKYAEGYPGRRYYGGCEWVDISEQLAIDRACALFGAEHANVQPHSGAQANTAVYHAMLQPGESTTWPGPTSARRMTWRVCVCAQYTTSPAGDRPMPFGLATPSTAQAIESPSGAA